MAFWRVAGEEINYRRFFDINELAAVRMEDPRVFAETHRLVLRLVGEGAVTGIRVDHPDGLYAPAAYFRQLQRACFRQARAGAVDTGAVTDADLLAPLDALETKSSTPPCPFYVVAEKILGAGSRCPRCGRSRARPVTNSSTSSTASSSTAPRRRPWKTYARFVRERVSFAEMAYRGKLLIMETSMASELHVLGHRLNVMSEKHRSSRDFTLGSLTHALRQLIASFPVYRTYVGDTPAGPAPTAISAADRDTLARAVTLAKGRTLARSVSTFDWLHDLLSLKMPAGATDEDRAERLDFVMRFQQDDGTSDRQGRRDTALYRYHRLVSLNEVGAIPVASARLAEFHAANAARVLPRPTGSPRPRRTTRSAARTCAPASTCCPTSRPSGARGGRLAPAEPPASHDRGRRARARAARGIPALPDARGRLADRRRPPPRVRSQGVPRSQGAHELGQPQRAIRRRRRRVSSRAIVDPERSRAFLDDFMPFQAQVAAWGLLNSLAQVVIKATAPGVPTSIRGRRSSTSAWSIPTTAGPWTGPGERRMLDELTAALDGGDLAGLARGLWEDGQDAALKLYVTRQSLHFRGARAPSLRTATTSLWRRAAPGRARVRLRPRRGRRGRGDGRAPPARAPRPSWTLSAKHVGARRSSPCPPLAGRYRDAFTGRSWKQRPVPTAPRCPGPGVRDPPRDAVGAVA